MISVNKDLLPKRITPNNISRLVGEDSYWFCPSCRQWRTTTITPDGVTCSVCGGVPDWKKHPPTLAFRSRFKRILNLCASGSDFCREYESAERQYADYIDKTHSGMSAKARDTGWRYFQSIWREADKVADYIIAAKDTPIMDIPYAFSEEGLQRRYYDPRRASNVISLSGLTDDNGMCFTYDIAESASYTAGYRHQFDDTRISIVEYLNGIFDPTE